MLRLAEPQQWCLLRLTKIILFSGFLNDLKKPCRIYKRKLIIAFTKFLLFQTNLLLNSRLCRNTREQSSSDSVVSYQEDQEDPVSKKAPRKTRKVQSRNVLDNDQGWFFCLSLVRTFWHPSSLPTARGERSVAKNFRLGPALCRA